MSKLKINEHRLSICAFSFFFAYILSFLFEGQVLYGILAVGKVEASEYLLGAIIAHFAGQFSCGFFCKSHRGAKVTMLLGTVLCFLTTIPFLSMSSRLWMPCLVIAGYAAGCGVAAWGYFLKKYTLSNQRIKSCADVLIFSNIIMVIINVIAINFSVVTGLVLSMLCLIMGICFVCLIPAVDSRIQNNGKSVIKNGHVHDKCVAKPAHKNNMPKAQSSIRKPMALLFLFITIITVNSGLMYQVINPGFEHLTVLVSWYWAVPYIVALIVMRNLPVRMNRTVFLYVGMGMIMCAFIGFMLMGRGVADYIIVDTLMLGACGIFDLFWWSLIGETLDYGKNPSMIFGVGISANVFGVLCGDLIGMGVTDMALPESQIAVIALCVVCITLIILPPLNNQFALLLKTHVYLSTYYTLSAQKKDEMTNTVKPLDALTEKETQVLKLLLDGKSNKEIAAGRHIAENTVKTHLKSIYSKYAVASRAELISLLLRSKEQ